MKKSLAILLVTPMAILSLALLSCCTTPTLEPLDENVQIEGDHCTLDGDVLRPLTVADKCPVAIIFHGLTGNRREAHLDAIADSLYSAGVAVVRFDFNGHGKSGGEFVDMTLTNEMVDARKVFAYVSSLPWVDTERIAIVGHSQGGLIGGVLGGELGDAVRCLVLLSPAACIHTMGLRGDMFGSRFDPSDIPPYIEFWGGSHLGREYLLSAQQMDVLSLTSPYKGPVMIVQGMNEDWTLKEDSMKYTEILRSVQYNSLTGFTHCYGEDVSVPAALTKDFIVEKFSSSK